MRTPTLWLLAALLVALPARAQRPDGAAAPGLPDEVAARLIAYVNDPEHVRFSGPTVIAAADTVRGDVAVLEGSLEVAGAVQGSVVVINGDVRLHPGASVAGDLWVIGGSAVGAESARISGELVHYRERLEYRQRNGRLERATLAGVDPEPWGSADLLVATGKSYNRVEGLPITFGPRVSTEGSNPLRVHALAIYRSEAGFRIHTPEMGYYVRAEQSVGGHEHLRVGATTHSLVEPIEDWHLSDLESGLATFLFHRDFRDHFEREGVSLFATWAPPAAPWSVTAELRRERHWSLASGSPWSLFDNAEPWRPQPLIAEGRLTSAVASATLDTRNDPDLPSNGWHAEGKLEQSLSTALTRPHLFPAPPPAGGAPAAFRLDPTGYGHFTHAVLDLRRYNRVDPRSRLNFRLFLAGPLAGGSLPPQLQHALGGEGSLPGYDLFARDCSARAEPVYRGGEESAAATAYYPRYGCDAVGLVQAELRGRLNFRLRWDSAPWRDEPGEDAEWGVGWDFAPDWAVFVDAGRGWMAEGGPDAPLAVDVGVGIVVSRLGLYLAAPLTGTGGVNAFIRLGPRF